MGKHYCVTAGLRSFIALSRNVRNFNMGLAIESKVYQKSEIEVSSLGDKAT